MFNQSNDKLQVICSASENDKSNEKENDLSSPKFVGVTNFYCHIILRKVFYVEANRVM